MDDGNFQSTCTNFVNNHVLLSASALVQKLVATAFQDGAIIDEDTACNLMDRAPTADDYEEANGYRNGDETITVVPEDDGFGWTVTDADGDDIDSGYSDTEAGAWRDAFDSVNEEHPDGGEVFEHWVVDDYFARLLRAHDETVVNVEEINMLIWARATTGQAITSDGVVRTIVRSQMAMG
jgi:peptidoglycan/xylan/chitin deacetylase (PgdA/CDA1 family)